MLEKPDVINALNNGGSGKNKNSHVTWNYILHVSKMHEFFYITLFLEILKYLNILYGVFIGYLIFICVIVF